MLRILNTRFPCSNYRVLLASRYRSICITVKKKNFWDAFILGPGIVIIGTGFIFEKISYESHVTYVAGFQKKFKENRSFVTGSGFEKKIRTDLSTGCFVLAVSKVNRCFNANFLFNTFCINMKFV